MTTQEKTSELLTRLQQYIGELDCAAEWEKFTQLTEVLYRVCIQKNTWQTRWLEFFTGSLQHGKSIAEGVHVFRRSEGLRADQVSKLYALSRLLAGEHAVDSWITCIRPQSAEPVENLQELSVIRLINAGNLLAHRSEIAQLKTGGQGSLRSLMEAGESTRGKVAQIQAQEIVAPTEIERITKLWQLLRFTAFHLLVQRTNDKKVVRDCVPQMLECDPWAREVCNLFALPC